MTKHSMDDKTGFEATDEEMGLKPADPTAGPWVAHRQSRAASIGEYNWSLQNDDTAFLMFDFHPEVNDDEQHDIARLLSAAPALRSATINAVASSHKLQDGQHDTPDGFVLISEAALADLMAALAKATGATL